MDCDCCRAIATIPFISINSDDCLCTLRQTFRKRFVCPLLLPDRKGRRNGCGKATGPFTDDLQIGRAIFGPQFDLSLAERQSNTAPRLLPDTIITNLECLIIHSQGDLGTSLLAIFQDRAESDTPSFVA